MPLQSQKSPLLVTKQAIKRSLKTKLKLIGAENKILVDTINGYVQKAEAVYTKLEASSVITPRQFSKAMAKLETVYSACVKLILMAADLFDEKDKSESTSESLTAESVSTSSGSLQVSAPVISERSLVSEVMPTLLEKETMNRLKKLELRFHDYVARKEQSASLASMPRVSIAEVPNMHPGPVKQVTVNPVRTDNLLRPDVSGDLDNFIEFQRFIYGLDKKEPDHNRCLVRNVAKKANTEDCHEKVDNKFLDNAQELPTIKSKPPDKEDVGQLDGDIQSNIIQKLENLERVLQKMSQNASVTHADQLFPPADSSYVLGESDSKAWRVAADRSGDGMVVGHVSADAHASVNSFTRCFEDHSKMAAHTTKHKFAKQQEIHDGSPKLQCANPSMLSFDTRTAGKEMHCPCENALKQHFSDQRSHQTMTQPCLHNRHLFNYALVSKPHVNDEGVGPSSVTQEMNKPPDSAAGGRISFHEQDHNDIVHKVVEMISAQLLPKIRGHLSAEYSHTDEATYSGAIAPSRQPRQSRPLSAPQVKWPSGQTSMSSASLSRVCDPLLSSSSRNSKKVAQNAGTSGNSTVRDGSCLGIHKDSLSSQIYLSASDCHGNQKVPCNASSRTYYSLQKQLRDLHLSLEDLCYHSKNNAVEPYSEEVEDYDERRQTTSGSSQNGQMNNAKTLDNSKSISSYQRSQHKASKSQQMEPLTIEIYNYQHTTCSPGLSLYSESKGIVDSDNEAIGLSPEFNLQQISMKERHNHQISVKKEGKSAQATNPLYSYHMPDALVEAKRLPKVAERKTTSFVPSDHLVAEPYEHHVHFRYTSPYKSHTSKAVADEEGSTSSSNTVCEASVGSRKESSVSSKIACGDRTDATHPKMLTHQDKHQEFQTPSYHYADMRPIVYQGSPNTAGKSDTASPTDYIDLASKEEVLRETISTNHELSNSTNNLSRRSQGDFKTIRTRSTKTICISNLPLNIEEIRLLYLLKPHGHVTKIYFIKHRLTGAFQGIAYIKFSKEEDAKAAAKALHKTDIDGQTVFARIHNQRKYNILCLGINTGGSFSGKQPRCHGYRNCLNFE